MKKRKNYILGLTTQLIEIQALNYNKYVPASDSLFPTCQIHKHFGAIYFSDGATPQKSSACEALPFNLWQVSISKSI